MVTGKPPSAVEQIGRAMPRQPGGKPRWNRGGEHAFHAALFIVAPNVEQPRSAFAFLKGHGELLR